MLLVGMPQAAAASLEHDHAWDDEPSSRTWYCTDSSYAEACFAPHGEWFAVWDKSKDGWSPVIIWGSYSEVTGDLLRQGRIWHLAGYGFSKMKFQNKSFYEGRKIAWKVCAGHHPDLEPHLDKCSPAVWRYA